MPGLGVNALPIKIPSNIAIITVEMGLLEFWNISMAITLFIPWENKQNTSAKPMPGTIDFINWNLTDTETLSTSVELSHHKFFMT